MKQTKKELNEQARKILSDNARLVCFNCPLKDDYCQRNPSLSCTDTLIAFMYDNLNKPIG